MRPPRPPEPMGRYVIRRLLQMIPVFIGTTLLIFLMVYALGDPVAGLCGDRQCDPATAAQLRAGLRPRQAAVAAVPAPTWGNIFTGDFGTAFNGQPVTELMAHRLPGHHPAHHRRDPLRDRHRHHPRRLTGLRRGRPVDTAVLLLPWS